MKYVVLQMRCVQITAKSQRSVKQAKKKKKREKKKIITSYNFKPNINPRV